MKHLIDVEYILKEYGEDHLIDAIYRHASQLGANGVISMIERYWQVERERLSQEDCSGVQGISVKEQLND